MHSSSLIRKGGAYVTPRKVKANQTADLFKAQHAISDIEKYSFIHIYIRVLQINDIHQNESEL